MTKLTVDDLVVAQRRTEAQLEKIADILRKPEKTPFQEFVHFFATVVAILVFLFGCFLANDRNLLGVCICIGAALARLERLMIGGK